jgi:hypothetical protein
MPSGGLTGGDQKCPHVRTRLPTHGPSQRPDTHTPSAPLLSARADTWPRTKRVHSDQRPRWPFVSASNPPGSQNADADLTRQQFQCPQVRTSRMFRPTVRTCGHLACPLPYCIAGVAIFYVVLLCQDLFAPVNSIESGRSQGEHQILESWEASLDN